MSVMIAHSDNHLCNWNKNRDLNPTCVVNPDRPPDSREQEICDNVTDLDNPDKCNSHKDPETNEQICHYNSNGYCDLEESQFDSNYCCKSIAGSRRTSFCAN